MRKVVQDRAKYHLEDADAVQAEVFSGAPQCSADTSAFDNVLFDGDACGTSSIDVTLKTSPIIMEMGDQEVRNAMEAIQSFCQQLSLDGVHLLLRSRACHRGSSNA